MLEPIVPPRKKRKTSKRKYKERKEFVPYVSFQEAANTAGSDQNPYKESSGTTSYTWNILPPLGSYNCLQNETKTRKVASLKMLCADKVACNLHTLERDFADYVPLSCLLMIWDRVLTQGNDSFAVYATFFAKLGEFGRFKPHKRADENLGTGYLDESSSKKQLQILRSRAVDTNTPPFAAHYRYENLFSNALISEIVYQLNKSVSRHLVVLDLSSAAYTIPKDNYYSIFNITNLMALSLATSKVIDDSFIGNMKTAISIDGKLSKLSVLKIDECPQISSKSVLDLLQRIRIGYGNLSYIETDHPFSVIKNERDRRHYVEQSRWYYMDKANKDVELISILPLGLKLHSLHKYFNQSDGTPSPVSVQPVIDIMLDRENYGEHMGPSNIDWKFYSLESAWKSRVHGRYGKPNASYIYAINVNHVVKEEAKVTKAPRRKTPKIKKTNTAQFFGL